MHDAALELWEQRETIGSNMLAAANCTINILFSTSAFKKQFIPGLIIDARRTDIVNYLSLGLCILLLK